MAMFDRLQISAATRAAHLTMRSVRRASRVRRRDLLRSASVVALTRGASQATRDRIAFWAMVIGTFSLGWPRRAAT